MAAFQVIIYGRFWVFTEGSCSARITSVFASFMIEHTDMRSTRASLFSLELNS